MIVLRNSILGLMASMSCIALAAANEGGGSSTEVTTMSVRAALSALKTDNDADWTEAGLPAMSRMKELTGREDLARSEVGEALPGFNRANADAAPTVKDDKPASPTEAKPEVAPGKSEASPETVNQPDGDQQGNAADGASREKPDAGAGEALNADADRPDDAGAGNVDHSSSTQHDAVHAERKGDDFGLDAKDDDTDNIPEDNRGRSMTDVDVQAVGLQEKVDDPQAATAASLAGNSDADMSDYDRGFVNGFRQGKTDAGNQFAAERDPATSQSDYATRELRNSVDPDQPESAVPKAAADPVSVLEAAGGDAIVLCEALVLAAAGDNFKRNSALTTFARGYLVSQGEIKEHQRRLDIRNQQRASESERLGTLKA